MSGHLELADGTRVAIGHGFVLGRVAGCDLVIDDGKASRKHARFLVEGGVVEIEDMQSSNGTLLNDKPVTRRMLRSGDRIQIGKTVLVFHDGAVPGSAAAKSPTASAPDLDDNDLFGDGPTEVAMQPPPKPAPAPAPPAAPAPVPAPVPAPPRTPPPPPPKPAVVEFADEVVEVKKAPPAAREPEIAVAPRAKPAPGAKADAPVASAPRILQFQNKPGARGGLMGDDLGQLSGGMRTILVLGALALGGAIVYGIVVLTS
ncbi:MAG: FHA domain-containing protein [Planctomycetes bacterium]|nr:FHA domain-containing protein [Planctomycetota bacterium]